MKLDIRTQCDKLADDALISVEDYAALTLQHRTAVYRVIARNEPDLAPPTVRLGKCIRMRMGDVREFFARKVVLPRVSDDLGDIDRRTKSGGRPRNRDRV